MMLHSRMFLENWFKAASRLLVMTLKVTEKGPAYRAATGETAGSAGDDASPLSFFIFVMPLADFDNDVQAGFSAPGTFFCKNRAELK